jgi:hypothetical protein
VRPAGRIIALWLGQFFAAWIAFAAWQANVASVTLEGSGVVGGFDADQFVAILIDCLPGFFIAMIVVLAAQAIFLVPVRRERARRERGRSLYASLALAGSTVVILVAGFAFAIINVFTLEPNLSPTSVVAVLAVSWLSFTLLLVAYARRRARDTREELLARIARRIFAGTIVEALGLVPFDLVLRGRKQCYCLSGSVIAYSACLAVGTIFLGPAIFLPLLAKRRATLYYDRHCDVCGATLEVEKKDYRGAETTRVCASCGPR